MRMQLDKPYVRYGRRQLTPEAGLAHNKFLFWGKQRRYDENHGYVSV